MNLEKNFFDLRLNKLSDRIRRNVLVHTDHGMMIVNRFDNNNGVGHGQWLLDHGNSNTVECQICMNYITRENPIIFDIGANIGTFSTWFATTFPEGRIYSFEPQPQVFNMLCGNMAINNYSNVRAFPYGLSDIEGKITINEPDYMISNDFGTFSLIDKKLPTTENLFTVELKTLDWFVDFYHIGMIDLLKIDVEGMDLQVLHGGVNTLKKNRPVIFIEHNDNVSTRMQEIQDFLLQFNYQFTCIGNNLLCR